MQLNTMYMYMYVSWEIYIVASTLILFFSHQNLQNNAVFEPRGN